MLIHTLYYHNSIIIVKLLHEFINLINTAKQNGAVGCFRSYGIISVFDHNSQQRRSILFYQEPMILNIWQTQQTPLFLCLFRFFFNECSLDQISEERMSVVRSALEFRVILNSYKEYLIRKFYSFYKSFVR